MDNSFIFPPPSLVFLIVVLTSLINFSVRHETTNSGSVANFCAHVTCGRESDASIDMVSSMKIYLFLSFLVRSERHAVGGCRVWISENPTDDE